MAGRIALKIGVWLVDRPLAIYFTQDGGLFSSPHVTVHTFKRIYPFPLAHRPKSALLVLANDIVATDG